MHISSPLMPSIREPRLTTPLTGARMLLKKEAYLYFPQNLFNRTISLPPRWIKVTFEKNIKMPIDYTDPTGVIGTTGTTDFTFNDLRKRLHNKCSVHLLNRRVYQKIDPLLYIKHDLSAFIEYALAKPDLYDISWQSGFRTACTHGKLEIAQTIYRCQPEIDVMYGEGNVFRDTYIKQHLEVLQWLHSIQPGYSPKEYIMTYHLQGHVRLDIVKWAVTIEPDLLEYDPFWSKALGIRISFHTYDAYQKMYLLNPRPHLIEQVLEHTLSNYIHVFNHYKRENLQRFLEENPGVKGEIAIKSILDVERENPILNEYYTEERREKVREMIDLLLGRNKGLIWIVLEEKPMIHRIEPRIKSWIRYKKLGLPTWFIPPPSNTECRICMEGSVEIELPCCQNAFCGECLLEWFEREVTPSAISPHGGSGLTEEEAEYGDNAFSCPLCRTLLGDECFH
jgi:hypothetical protein